MKTTFETQVVPIRTVCALFGLNPNTLRTWERRYGLVQPLSSEGGHRGYTESDVAIIGAMVRHLEAGSPPSIAAEKAKSEVQMRHPRVAGLTTAAKDLRKGIDRLAAPQAMEIASRAVREFGYQATVEQLLFPELIHRGENWAADGGIAREHLASLVTRGMMILRQIEMLSVAAGPPVILACAPGEAHDLPLLHASNLLCETGEFSPITLVAGMPIEHVIQSAVSAQAVAIVLSATIAPHPAATREWLQSIVEAAWEDRTILAGGGFNRSRVFSGSSVKSAPGGYGDLIRALQQVVKT